MNEGDAVEGSPGVERLATGVPGLDAVLAGGLVRCDVALIAGEPGTGKTTLGNQLAFRHAAGGGVALYATVLTEPHDRMLTHLAGFAFLAPELVGTALSYLSLAEVFAEDGMEGGLGLLRRTVRERGATLLVVDGAARLADFADSAAAFRRFAAMLQGQLAALGCTTVLLAQEDGGETVRSLGTHVDGILLLETGRGAGRDRRFLRVTKLRGASPLTGPHEFAIGGDGVAISPRLEAVLAPAEPPAGGARNRSPFGIPDLDAMLGGGLPSGSTTLIYGPTGAGKTTLSLHFLAEGTRRGEPGLMAGFHESPVRLREKTAALGLASSTGESVIRFAWEPRRDRPLDAWGAELLATVSAHGLRRLVVDAIGDLADLAPDPDRLAPFLSALADELRAAGVTALFIGETGQVVAPTIEFAVPAASATLDNALVLRYVEFRSQLRRLVSVVKVRDSGFDPSLREFAITGRGIVVAETFASAEAILTGTARLLARPDVGVGG